MSHAADVNACIDAIIVSRNGKSVLPGLLDSLLAQAEPLRRIVVVDNASTDGTVESVRSNYPAVTILGLDSNQGVGGGYSAGLEYALAGSSGWFWMLDQDSRPRPDTVSTLLRVLRAFAHREKIGIIAPLPIHEESGTPYPLFVWNDGQVEVPIDFGEADLRLVDMVISSGSLVSREALQVAGLPRKDFFMDFVDYEHCLRLRRCGFLVAVVTSCTMPHTIGQPRAVRRLRANRIWTTHPPWRDYYKVRNRAFVVWHQLPSPKAKIFVISKLAVQIVGSLFYDTEKTRRIRFMLRGFRDALRGELGRQVVPPGSPSNVLSGHEK